MSSIIRVVQSGLRLHDVVRKELRRVVAEHLLVASRRRRRHHVRHRHAPPRPCAPRIPQRRAPRSLRSLLVLDHRLLQHALPPQLIALPNRSGDRVSPAQAPAPNLGRVGGCAGEFLVEAELRGHHAGGVEDGEHRALQALLLLERERVTQQLLDGRDELERDRHRALQLAALHEEQQQHEQRLEHHAHADAPDAAQQRRVDERLEVGDHKLQRRDLHEAARHVLCKHLHLHRPLHLRPDDLRIQLGVGRHDDDAGGGVQARREDPHVRARAWLLLAADAAARRQLHRDLLVLVVDDREAVGRVGAAVHDVAVGLRARDTAHIGRETCLRLRAQRRVGCQHRRLVDHVQELDCSAIGA
mmetsp:Transcript_32952/g.77669  ORF Transcript_32952/g.77669 Transcript_32952/m.77669 type:complete len:358 (-) Transcript_32952:917-1990(-)